MYSTSAKARLGRRPPSSVATSGEDLLDLPERSSAAEKAAEAAG